MSVFSALIGIGWLIFNVALVIPCAILLFYTIHSVFLVLAAVEDLDAPEYERLQLGGVVEESAAGSTLRTNRDGAKPLPVTSSLRSMIRLLYLEGKYFSLVRGYGWFLLWSMAKALVLLMASYLPWFLAAPVQILFSLGLTQLHALWVHTIIVSSSSKSLKERLVPARVAFKALALPMSIFLVAEATTQRILYNHYQAMKLTWEDFFPMGSFQKTFLFWVLLFVLSVFLVIPSQLLLVRVEASVLSDNEETIVPLDPSLAASQEEYGYKALVGACKSLTRTLLANLTFLYVKIFCITLVSVVVIGCVDFWWYIIMALVS